MIVATHRDLEEQVKSGAFRQDLYHRVFVFPIVLPPLRERREDIPALVDHFVRTISEQNGWKPKPFSSEAIEMLAGQRWPGNVRELRNFVERLLLLADAEVDGETVRLALPRPADIALEDSGTLAERVERFERATIIGELKRQARNMTETARTLGLERSHLYKKCTQLGVDLQALDGK